MPSVYDDDPNGHKLRKGAQGLVIWPLVLGGKPRSCNLNRWEFFIPCQLLDGCTAPKTWHEKESGWPGAVPWCLEFQTGLETWTTVASVSASMLQEPVVHYSWLPSLQEPVILREPQFKGDSIFLAGLAHTKDHWGHPTVTEKPGMLFQGVLVLDCWATNGWNGKEKFGTSLRSGL